MDEALTKNVMGPAAIASELSDLGVDDFEISWRCSAGRIGAADIESGMGFFALVGGFWRWVLDEKDAERVETCFRNRLAAEVKAHGFIPNTLNLLLVEFKKPNAPHGG